MDDLSTLQELTPVPDIRGSEQNTAALIASSMTSQYEEEWPSTAALDKELAPLNPETTSCSSGMNSYLAFNSDYPSETTQPPSAEDGVGAVALPPTDPVDSCDYTDLDSFQLMKDETSKSSLGETRGVNKGSEVAPKETEITKKPKSQGGKTTPKKTKLKGKKNAQPKKSRGRVSSEIPSIPLPLLSTQVKKIPSYLTAFPMRCKDYPMVYCCNDCARIFTAVRAAQLHECIKKRRGRKATNNSTTV